VMAVRSSVKMFSRVFAALAVFLLLSTPYIVALSHANDRVMFNDAGRLNYAWEINRVKKWAHWQGEEGVHGTPVHPTRKIHEDPPMYEFGTPFEVTYPPWYNPTYWYDGVRRRFELKGRIGGVSVYDDYAHHPVKVAAQLRAARQLTAARGRLIVAFQPHLYSRTLEFVREFGTALALADEVVVLDVYGAREDPIPGVNGGLIAKAVPLPPERVHYVPERSEVPSVLAGLASSGDIIITMGAGDITALGSELLDQLARKGRPS